MTGNMNVFPNVPKKLILSFILCFLLGVFLGHYFPKIIPKKEHPCYSLYGKFDNIGSLKEGDPIERNGIVGKIGKLGLYHENVVVEMKIDSLELIPKESEFIIVNRGTNGDRMIRIQKAGLYGKIGAYQAGDSVVGQFEPGILEWLIGSMEMNFQKIDTIYKKVNEINFKISHSKSN